MPIIGCTIRSALNDCTNPSVTMVRSKRALPMLADSVVLGPNPLANRRRPRPAGRP
jgi:hypothetical protein